MMLQACSAWAQPNEFSFGVIAGGSAKNANRSGLARAIADTDADNLAFVVANGIKSGDEACSDRLYAERKTMLDEAKNGVILSLAASDWANCKKSDGKSAAVERLSRLREVFFEDEFSLGSTRIPVVRQSSTPKFRSYSENTRWELDNILFATINLPANNNHYLAEAGRNSEFEDRLIANQDWLQRVFMFAIHKKLDGLVLFSDGNPFLSASSAGSENARSKRDGFAETRQQIARLAAKFPGKVLIVTAQKSGAPSASSRIIWRNNIGILEAGSGLAKITSDPAASRLFSVSGETVMTKNARR
ncbi:MAG: hypothetical protein V4632_13430 [Pseudomonadota bacterium]